MRFLSNDHRWRGVGGRGGAGALKKRNDNEQLSFEQYSRCGATYDRPSPSVIVLVSFPFLCVLRRISYIFTCPSSVEVYPLSFIRVLSELDYDLAHDRAIAAERHYVDG